MKYKKSILILILTIILFTISAVNASDINDMLISSENADQAILSLNNEITDDNLQISKENSTLTQRNNDEILGADEGTYSQLVLEIGSGGNVELQHNYYIYDSGSTITISVDNSVIDGKGAVIDMNGATNMRALNVSASGVTIKNLTIKNANYDFNGGAVYFNSSGTVTNCNFINNSASNGGAIFAMNKINLLDSIFDNNAANKSGGAVYVGGSFSDSVINSTFIDNNAFNGGALYVNGDVNNVIVNGCFKGNEAERGGGAIFVRGQAKGNNFSAEFYDNRAMKASGGAIFFYKSAENNIFESVLIDNYALYGGSLFFYNKANNNKFNSEFINNTAESCGGAIFFHNTTDKNNFSGCFINNSALGNVDPENGNGGAITFKDVSTNSLFTCDFINNTAALYGGGVNYRHTPHNITFNSNFINNNASTGGGVNFFESFENVIFNGEFIDNSAVNGGAIAAGEGIVSDVTFKNNHAENGGAVYFNSSGTVTNCNFTDNTVSGDGGSVYFNANGEVTNCSFVNGYATGWGGAVYFNKNATGNVTNCNFTDNSAGGGGALFFFDNGTVTNCSFTENAATVDGGAISMTSGSVESCNFVNNTAKMGGAIGMSGTVSNCIFTDNTATLEGGALWMGSSSIENCSFTGNNAPTGSAIHFWSTSVNMTVSNSILLNNKAKAEVLDVVKNDDNITITFTGQNNLLNAIYSRSDVNFTNVSYWGANGIANTGSSAITPSRSNKEAGQNITVGIVVNDILVLNEVKVTDENGTIFLNINAGENYYITARHDSDSYYTEAERTISNNNNFSVNVTSQTTYNKSVNITAKSNIYGEVMPGKLLFILPNGTQINATYATNGTWWAVHNFDDFGVYQINASYVGLDNVTINNGTISISKTPTEITVEPESLDLKVDDEVYINATLTPADAGNLIFTSSDDSIVTVDENGTVKAVGEGSAIITVIYAGDDKYDPSNATVSVNVSKSGIEPEIKQNDTTLTVEVPSDATGNITVTIGNETLVAPIEDGIATFNLSDVPAGDYNATVSYPGDNKYSGFDVVVPVSIESKFLLIAENLTKYYHGAERFAVKVVDGKGNPISGMEVKILINGVTYTRITDEKGSASIGINLESGEYIATVSCNNTTVEATVTVLTTVNGTDLVKVFRNATQYYATFRDSEGNYLKDGTTVRFNIHGVFYDRIVSGGKGLAKLNINLEQGEYIITAINLVTGESRANKITVLPRIVENYDLTKYYRNASQYTVKLIGDDGNPVGAGENVTFNINGVFYTRTTNASGIAKLNINLQPGDYIITADYKGCMVSNKINVLPVLTAQDFTKKYGTPDQFTASLVDGQGKAYEGQKIEFNINGIFYYRMTDSNGQAKLNINLQPGEYIITSTYNGASIGNKVTVTA